MKRSTRKSSDDEKGTGVKTVPIDNEMSLFNMSGKENYDNWCKLDELPREDHFEPKFTPNKEQDDKFKQTLKKIGDYFEENFREEQDLAYHDKQVAFSKLQLITTQI